MRGDALLLLLRRLLPCPVHLHSSDDVMTPPASSGATAYVVNTDWARGPGEHYVAFYVTRGSVRYYDSYGVPPYDLLLDWWRAWGLRRLAYSPHVLQSLDSNACAFHVCAFLKCASLGVTYDAFLDTFPASDSLADNDRHVRQLVRHFLADTV